jgi:hypothetical protein
MVVEVLWMDGLIGLLYVLDGFLYVHYLILCM